MLINWTNVPQAWKANERVKATIKSKLKTSAKRANRGSSKRLCWLVQFSPLPKRS